ncbi:4Fe4S-binding leucine-rich repeat protein [Xanthobacter sediminis]|uniref:4Fe4S-binding leucine-rich repeat protein n=1 Tax=Xanthobacter sediminis TaxID=3119926 RepID=UPI003727D38E
MTDDIDEAKNWLGDDIDCATCAHQEMLATGRCRLKHACVNDRYARRIDRFFNWNPELASGYVRHEHFEVRAIAAKHADVFVLPPLLDDPEETVRWNAARRLPKRLILRLRTDPHREVRIRMVSLLDDAELIPMLADPDYYVRLVVARRVAPPLLSRIVNDPEEQVRKVVAQRLPAEWLPNMMTDPAATVRLEVAQRLPPDLLSGLIRDPDWRVRHEVAGRIGLDHIDPLLDDADEFVREVARTRRDGGAPLVKEMPR